jgi:hypothetical protein
MTIEVTVFGTEKVDKALRTAPIAATEYMRKWLFHESRTFVGNKKRDGTFRRELRNKTNSRGKKWSPFVAKRFKGYVEKKDTLNMALHMGPNLSGNKKLRLAPKKNLTRLGVGRVLEQMENPYTIAPSRGKWLIIPNKNNLAKIGIRKGFMYRFEELYNKGFLTMVPGESGGVVSYFLDEDGINKNKKLRNPLGAQLFFGVRRTRVKKQFSFVNSWNARVPSALKRGERYLGSAMNKAKNLDVE